MDDRGIFNIGLLNDFPDGHARHDRAVELAGQNEAQRAFNRVVVEYRGMEEGCHDGLEVCPQFDLLTHGLPE